MELALIHSDGVMGNAVTGMNDPAYDKTVHSYVDTATRLHQNEVEDLYEGNWICANCIDAYPLDATREWVEIKLGGKARDKQVIDSFNTYQTRLHIAKTIELADKWSRLYGGAAIIAVIEDGQPFDKPVRLDRIRTIRRLVVLDRYKVRPVIHDTDPINPDFYELVLPPHLTEAFQLATNQPRVAAAGLRIHKSRVTRFDGVELPPEIMRRREGWGGGILNRIYDTFNRFEMTNSSVANLVEEVSIFKYAMKGLKELLAKNDEKSVSQLRRRLSSMFLQKGNKKALVFDADGESAEIMARSFTGLPEVMDRLQAHMVGASDVPATILFGRGPIGLAAQGTGDAEDKVWGKKVKRYQESNYRPKLTTGIDDTAGLFDLIWLAQDGPTKGKTPDDWSFTFKSLVQPTLEEDVALRERQANVDRTYKDMEVLTNEEIRNSRYGGSDYTIETTLDELAWRKKQQAAEEGLDQYSDYGWGDEEGTPEDAGTAQLESSNQPALPAGQTAAPVGATPALAGRQDAVRQDDATPIKYVLKWQGLQLGVTHEPGDLRHDRPMAAIYCHVRGSYGAAEDGMAIDAYLGPNPESVAAFKVRQLKSDGTVDETKWIFGCDSIVQARDLYLRHMPQMLFGGIEAASLTDLSAYRKDAESCGCEACQTLQPRRKKKRQNPQKLNELGDGQSILKSRSIEPTV